MKTQGISKILTIFFNKICRQDNKLTVYELRRAEAQKRSHPIPNRDSWYKGTSECNKNYGTKKKHRMGN